MPIIYDAQRNLWVLETQHSGYAFGLHPGSHLLKHTWWGERLEDPSDYHDLSGYRDRETSWVPKYARRLPRYDPSDHRGVSVPSFRDGAIRFRTFFFRSRYLCIYAL